MAIGKQLLSMKTVPSRNCLPSGRYNGPDTPTSREQNPRSWDVIWKFFGISRNFSFSRKTHLKELLG